MSTRIHVGTPIKNFRGWAITEVKFYGYANLPTARDEYVISPEFSCFGHQWTLEIYPGGRSESAEGFTTVALTNLSNAGIKVEYGFNVRNADGREVVYGKTDTKEFVADGQHNEEEDVWSGYYYANFATRSELIDLLVDGSLVIEVRIRPSYTNKSITQFIPTNPINKHVLELFNEEETADVVFEVGGEQQKGKRKRAKTSSTNFYAHRIILQKCSPTLYEMCKADGEEGNVTTVSITDVKPKIFEHMIYYAYGGKLSDEDLSDAKDIINACDKYGLVHLKLEAEAVYVESTEITMDNMMDNLLYADSKNLALLKEAVMDYIVANKHDIIGKVSFDNFPSHLVTDLLTAMARGEEAGDDEEEDKVKYNKMRVGTLRKMLDENGFDVDGSREAMIALLKEHDDDDNDD